MKTHLRNYVASAMLLLPAAAAMLAAPSAVLAQPAMPEVDSLRITADAGLRPGSLLSFRLTGTPRGQASVRIRGLRENIALRETAPGIFVGDYTIKRSDRIERDSEVRATLRRGNRQASANYELSETMTAVVVPPPPPPAPVQPPPRIERFGMLPLERIEPGADLRFALEGTPGGTVAVDLPGVTDNLALREVRPGVYEGSYTIRRADNLDPRQPFVATLRIRDRVATSNMAFPAVRPAPDNQPPTVSNISPREGEQIRVGAPLQIGGSFDDGRGSGVDPASVQVLLSGRNVTRDAQISRQAFSLRAALPPGRHTVEVTARDLAGNTVRKAWSFEVTGGIVAPPPVVVVPPPMVVVPVLPASLAVQVLNHYPNAEIGPDPVVVKGRTAPNAVVSVNVRAVPPPPPAAGQPRTVFAQTLQADHDGIFSFTMVPGTPYPGERYDISMVARSGNQSQESRFSLQQR